MKAIMKGINAVRDSYWRLCCLAFLAATNTAFGEGLPQIKVGDVNIDDEDPLSTIRSIIFEVAEWVIYLLGLVVVIVVVMIVISEAREARQSEEGRWGRVLGAFVGGLATIVGVMFLLNYAVEMLPDN